ncbi:putative permease [Escherichia coli]|uniref:Putative permease n=1 Tax=Escherichia coli TaxID=562 RepID=A0A377KH28_ECOLX|nr:putative permease [Escherichia coli]
MFIPRLPIYDRSWIAAPIGAVAGALGAAFSTNGPPMVIYGMLRNLGPAAFRGTLKRFLHRKQHRGDRRAGDQRNFDCLYL